LKNMEFEMSLSPGGTEMTAPANATSIETSPASAAVSPNETSLTPRSGNRLVMHAEEGKTLRENFHDSSGSVFD